MESFLSCPDLKNATKRVVLMRRTGTAKRKISIIGSMMIVASDCVRWVSNTLLTFSLLLGQEWIAPRFMPAGNQIFQLPSVKGYVVASFYKLVSNNCCRNLELILQYTFRLWDGIVKYSVLILVIPSRYARSQLDHAYTIITIITKASCISHYTPTMFIPWHTSS